jgi:hypothetical protein
MCFNATVIRSGLWPYRLATCSTVVTVRVIRVSHFVPSLMQGSYCFHILVSLSKSLTPPAMEIMTLICNRLLNINL